jgi:hypothetical protein
MDKIRLSLLGMKKKKIKKHKGKITTCLQKKLKKAFCTTKCRHRSPGRSSPPDESRNLVVSLLPETLSETLSILFIDSPLGSKLLYLT